jgi:hypothetical protein
MREFNLLNKNKFFVSGVTGLTAMNKEIKIGIAVMAVAILISGFIGSQLSAAHQADCENHKNLLEQAQREFPSLSGLNGQMLPQLQYLSDKCSDLNMGSYKIP